MLGLVLRMVRHLLFEPEFRVCAVADVEGGIGAVMGGEVWRDLDREAKRERREV